MTTDADPKHLLEELMNRQQAKRPNRKFVLSAEQVRMARQVWDLATANDERPPWGLVTELARHFKVSNIVMNNVVQRTTYRWVKQ